MFSVRALQSQIYFNLVSKIYTLCVSEFSFQQQHFQNYYNSRHNFFFLNH